MLSKRQELSDVMFSSHLVPLIVINSIYSFANAKKSCTYRYLTFSRVVTTTESPPDFSQKITTEVHVVVDL